MFGKSFNPYKPEDEGPEAQLARLQQLEEELREATARELIKSLTPADAQLELFSYDEITTYGLRHNRRAGGLDSLRKYPRG